MADPNYDEIMRLKEQRPFKPFVIETDDGQRYEVTDWLHLALSPTNPIMIFVHPDGGGSSRIRRDKILAVREAESAA